jgi:F-type H+-transporting ATPase subunit c
MTSSLEKSLRIVLAATIAFGILAAPAIAAEPTSPAAVVAEEAKHDTNLLRPLVAVGAGIVVLGGAFAIGRLATAAMEGTARQPEAGGAIRTSMIIAAALIEGFTLFALIGCMIATK